MFTRCTLQGFRKDTFIRLTVFLLGNCVWTSLGEAAGEFMFVNTDNKMDFDDAQSFCTEKGGKLFEPRDANVLEDVINQAKIEFANWGWGSYAFWLGIHDKDEDGTWVYASDNLPIEFSNWAPGYPSNSDWALDNCGVVGLTSFNMEGKWIEMMCSIDLPFVCTSKVFPKVFRKQVSSNASI